MPRLGQSYKWTAKQRKAASIRMKSAYAKKRFNEASQPKPGNVIELEAKVASVDIDQIREFNFRRGLVTAMECILRELR